MNCTAAVIERAELEKVAVAESPIGVETAAIHQVATLVGYPVQHVTLARTRFALLGDPERRTVLERIARRPQCASERLPGITGLTIDDVHHRVRSLRKAGILVRDAHHIYRADPEALRAFARYIDVLLTIAALHHGKGRGDSRA